MIIRKQSAQAKLLHDSSVSLRGMDYKADILSLAVELLYFFRAPVTVTSLNAAGYIHVERLEAHFLMIGHYMRAFCQPKLTKKNQKSLADVMVKV